MTINSFLYISFIIIYIQQIHCQISLSNIVPSNSYEIKKCTNDLDCPDYSNTCGYINKQKNEKHCLFTLYCHENEGCLPKTKDIYYNNINKTDTVNEPIKSNITIIESCSKSYKDCNTRKCTKNSDCYSEICDNGKCLVNVQKPLYICSEKNNNIICKKSLQESCKSNLECVTQYCDGQTEICIDVDADNPSYGVIIIGFLLFVILVIFACCCYKIH